MIGLVVAKRRPAIGEVLTEVVVLRSRRAVLEEVVLREGGISPMFVRGHASAAPRQENYLGIRSQKILWVPSRRSVVAAHHNKCVVIPKLRGGGWSLAGGI